MYADITTTTDRPPVDYSTFKITGTSLATSGFRIHETQQTIDVESVMAVLHGELAAYRIHNFLPPQVCTQIVHNFLESSKKVPRYGEGADGVEGYFLGASHIEKTTSEYLKEVQYFEESIHNVFHHTINPLDQFRQALIAPNSQYHTVRPAYHGKFMAGNAKFVYWNNLGRYLLLPHEDYAQTKDPLQYDFEIQSARRIMAVNFYAVVPPHAGQLKIWNMEPDDQTRAALNLTYSGYPYPAELLNNLPSMTIPVETGEMCLINGNLLHAVLRGNPTTQSKDRILITCFMTFNERNELIWWT